MSRDALASASARLAIFAGTNDSGAAKSSRTETPGWPFWGALAGALALSLPLWSFIWLLVTL